MTGWGDGSWQRLPDGRWRLQVSYGTVNGRRHRKTFTGRTKDECREQADSERDRLRKMMGPSSAEPLSMYIERWLEQREPYLRAKTLSAYSVELRGHVLPVLGGLTVDRLTRHHVERMLTQLVSKPLPGRKRPLSVTSANHARTVLGTALQDAVRDGLIPSNPARLARPLPAGRHEITPLTIEQVAHFLRATEGSRWHPVYLLAARLGMRQGEILGLAWSDVDMDAGELTIRHTLGRSAAGWRLQPPKTARSRRTLPLTPALVAALQSHRERQNLERQWAGKAWMRLPWALVFRTPQGRPENPRSLLNAFQRHLEAAGLPRQRFHDLRHAAASHLLARGVDLRIVQETLGHSTIAVTADTYSHVNLDTMREALERLD